MEYKVYYFREVRSDIKEAKRWYRSQQNGLEKKFAEDIKTSVLRLKVMPFVHAVRYENVRIAHADKFPYAIHFYIDESIHQVVIIAIVHNTRNPDVPHSRIS